MPEQSINEQTRQMMGMPTSGDPAIIDPTTGRPYTPDASMRQQEEITRQAKVKEEFNLLQDEKRADVRDEAKVSTLLETPETENLAEEITEDLNQLKDPLSSIKPKARPKELEQKVGKLYQSAVKKAIELDYISKEEDLGEEFGGYLGTKSNLRELDSESLPTITKFITQALGVFDPNQDVTKTGVYWCAAFVNHILTEMGADTLGKGDRYRRLRAQEYINYGQEISFDDMQEGDILLFGVPELDKVTHVGFYTGERDGEYVNMLGGNQRSEKSLGELVNIVPRSLKDIVGVRRVTYDGDAAKIIKDQKGDNSIFRYFDADTYGASFIPSKSRKYNEGGDVSAQMDLMLPKKGMSYGELILDNVLGLDNEYESFGEKLGKAINKDEVGFLKDASVGVYEGAKEFITSPVQTTKKVFSEIKDSVQRLGSENLNTRLNNMYGVSYADATDDQVNSAKEAVFGDAITALSLVPAAKATVSVAKAGVKNTNINKVMTLGETEGSTFKGKLNLVHGFNPPTDAPNLVPTFTTSEKYGGERYGELDGAETPGGSYGATGVYLENPSDPLFFNSPEMQGFYAPKTAQVSAQFNKAFILRPDTLKELEQITGINLKDSLPKIEDGNLKEKNYLAEEQGALVSVKLKELGYDGLIVKDFFLGDKEIDVYDKYEPLRKKIELKYKEKFGKPIPEKGTKEHQEIINLYDKQNKELEKIYSQAGIHPLLTQPQIIHLKPETLSTEKVFPESLQSNPNQVSNLQGTQPIQGERTPGYLERALNKLPEYDPSTLGSMGGNITLKGGVGTGLPKVDMIADTPAGINNKTITQSAVDLMNEPAFGKGFAEKLQKVAAENSIAVGDKTFSPMQVYTELKDRVGSDDFTVVPSKPKAANSPDEPKIISFTKKKEDKELENFNTNLMSSISKQASKQAELVGELQEAGVYGDYQKGVRVQSQNYKGEALPPYTITGLSLNKVKLNNPNLKRVEDRLGIKFEYIEKDGDYYLPMLSVEQADGGKSQVYLDALKQRDTPIMDGPKDFNKGGAVMNEQMKMAFMQQGGLKDDGMKRDPVSGNEVPNGSMAKEVRDDIPAQLSEGEYVVPADVVRYLGVKHFEDLRNKAKSGLQNMEANGRIGGEPVPVGGPQMAEGGDLTPEEMNEIKMLMNQGGMVAEGTDVPPYANVSPYSSFTPTSGFSWERNETATAPELPTETKTLYGPNGEVVTLTLPKDQQKYDELIAQGYTETQPVTPTVRSGGDGSSNTPSTAPGTPGTSFTGFKNWGAEIDWTDPESVKKFVTGQYNMPDPALRKGAGVAGLLGAGPLAAVGTVGSIFMAGQVLDTVADLRTSVMIAKAYGNTEGAAIAQAKLDTALKGAPSYVTSMLGDTLASGTMQFAGHVSGASGLDDLPSNIDEWTKNDFTRFQSATGKQAPVKAAASKAEKAATPSSYDTTTKQQIKQMQSDRSEQKSAAQKAAEAAGSAAIEAARKRATENETDSAIVTSERIQETMKKSKEDLESEYGSGLNKGGLMKKKRKK